MFNTDTQCVQDTQHVQDRHTTCSRQTDTDAAKQPHKYTQALTQHVHCRHRHRHTDTRHRHRQNTCPCTRAQTRTNTRYYYQGVDEGFTQHVEHVELRERHIVVVERAQKQLPKNKLARGTAKRHIHVGISSPETAGIECSGFRV